MSLEWAVTTFGYPAVLAGTFFEGEIILILAGFAAHGGYLSLPLVMLTGFLGTLFGDQFYFLLGRRKGRAVLDRHPGWGRRVARFRRLMERYDNLIMIGFRFLYGLRTISPFAIGLSDIPAVKFLVFNIISAAVWAVAVGGLGYVSGHAMTILIGEIKHYEMAVMAGLLVLSLTFYAVKRILNRKKRP